MAGRERIATRVTALLAGLLIVLLTPEATLALPKAPVTSRLELAGTPAPGGVARVIWAGVPDVTPTTAELTFQVHGPDGKTQRYAQAIKLQAGKAADATLTFPTARAGRYLVTASLKLSAQGKAYVKEEKLKFMVAVPSERSPKPPMIKTRTAVAPGDLFISSKPVSKTERLIINGGPVSGNISSSGDADWFQFDLTTSQTVTLLTQYTGSLEDPYMYLYGPDDTEEYIDKNDDGSAAYMSRIRQTLLPGSYYVMIRGYDEDCVGTYALIAFNDELVITTQTLTVDDSPTHGILKDPAKGTWYSFNVAAKGPYCIELLPNGLPEDSDTQLELFGPGNAQTSIAVDDDGAWYHLSRITRELDPGTYYIKVTGKDSDTQFIIHVLKGSKGLPVAIKNDGTTVTGKINQIWGYDWYQFTVPQAGYYQFKLLPGSMKNSRWYLYALDGTGNMVNQEEIIYNPLNETYLLASGTYFIKVEEKGSYYDIDGQHLGTGDYQLSVLQLDSISPIPITPGFTPATGIIDVDHDAWFRFVIAEERDYTIFVPAQPVDGSAGFGYCARLYNGLDLSRSLTSTSGDADEPIFMNVHLKPGTYFLNLYIPEGSAPGRYACYILDRMIPSIILDNAATSGNLAAVGNSQWYEFYIGSADIYTMEVQNGTLSGQSATIYGPNSMTTQMTQLTTTGKGRASRFTKYLNPGLYFVKVQGAAGGGTGSFTIQLRKAYFDLNIDRVPQDAALPSAGDVDYYSFQVDNVASYTIETSAGTLTGAVLRLYGPDDNTKYLAKDDHSGGNGMPKIVAKLAPGRYYLKFQGRLATDKGTYAIQVRKTYAYLSEDDRSITATIRYRNDAAYFFFTVDSEAKYSIVTKAGTLKHNYLRLYGPNSDTTLLTQNAQSDARGLARISKWLFPGTYYVKLQGLTSADVGDCQLQIFRTYETLAINDPQTTKTLGYAGEVKYYKFQVETEASYSIETESTYAASVSGTFLRLYGPSLDTLYITCNTGAGALGRLEKVLRPGTYYLTVQARSAAETGSFLIRVRNTITPLTLNTPATAGLIADRNDVDWYSFQIEIDTDYTIETRAGTLGDDFIALYGPSSATTPLAQADNYAGQNMARLTMRLKTGNYTVGVRGCHPASDLGTYTIQVRAAIMPVAVNGAPVIGAIDFASDIDWYSFTVTTTTTYRVETWAGTMSDTYLRLYGPDDDTKLIGWSASYSPDRTATVVMKLAPGTYYAQVRAGHAGVLGTYQILVRPDGIMTLTLNAEEMVYGYIAPAGDIDWYTFTVTEEGDCAVELSLWTTTDLYVRLYGPDDKTKMIDQYSTGQYGHPVAAYRSYTRSYHMKPGTYTLRVQGYSAGATMPYKIGVDWWGRELIGE